MQLDLTGKTALITGGSRGIGRTTVKTLAAAGARVAFTYRSSTDEATDLKEKLEEAGHEVLLFQGDAAEPSSAAEAIDGVIDAWERLDILVNNAGITRDGLLLRLKEEDWDAVINTNLKSVYNFSKAAYRQMMRQRSGKIINISSVIGKIGNPGQTNYAASKAGIIGFSKSLAKELAGRSVCVNVVAPGYVATEMTESLAEDVREKMLDTVPLGRAAEPEDVANAVLYLASPLADYITGHVLHVDGGLAM